MHKIHNRKGTHTYAADGQHTGNKNNKTKYKMDPGYTIY